MDRGELDEVINLALNTQEFQTGTESPNFFYKKTLIKWIKSKKKNGILLVAKKNKEVIGFMITSYNVDSREAYMHTIVVKKKYRNIGAGGKLLKQTLIKLKKLGCNHIFGVVKENNKSTLKYLQKHGFSIGKRFKYVDKML